MAKNCNICTRCEDDGDTIIKCAVCKKDLCLLSYRPDEPDKEKPVCYSCIMTGGPKKNDDS